MPKAPSPDTEIASVKEETCAFASELARLLVSHYGRLEFPLSKRVNSENGTVLDPSPIVDELGDYLQNIYYAGFITGQRTLCQWSQRHLTHLIGSHQTPLGLFHTHSHSKSPPYYPGGLWTIKNLDTLIGLASMYLLTRDPQILSTLDRFQAGLWRHFQNGGHIYYGGIPPLKLPVWSPFAAGCFAEEFLNLYEQTKNSKYLTSAQELLDAQIQTKFFQRHKLFPYRNYPSPLVGVLLEPFFTWRNKPEADTAILVKDNVYILFALLRSVELTQNTNHLRAATSCIEHLLQNFIWPSGEIAGSWHPVRGYGPPRGLQHSHSVLELLIDAYRILERPPYLEAASRIADFWRRHKNGLDLIPESPNASYALLDPSLDFMVNCLKLHELTRQTAYLETATAIFRAVRTHFHLPYGLAWCVETETGRPLEKTIETKYLGLAIKAACVLHQISQGEEIFSNPILCNVARDR